MATFPWQKIKDKVIPFNAVKTVAMTMMTVVVGILIVDLGDDLWSKTLGLEGTVCACGPGIIFIKAFSNDDGVVNSWRDQDDEGTDPGYDKDVAICEAEIVNSQTVKITVTNGYPSYTCRFWTKIRNVGGRKLRRKIPIITAPPGLTVEIIERTGSNVLCPGNKAYEGFSVHVEQSAEQGARYQFALDLKFTEVYRK